MSWSMTRLSFTQPSGHYPLTTKETQHAQFIFWPSLRNL